MGDASQLDNKPAMAAAGRYKCESPGISLLELYHQNRGATNTVTPLPGHSRMRRKRSVVSSTNAGELQHDIVEHPDTVK